ncbi:hypothetical protein AOQ84DRAFT_329127 [Glonium stellatum]|uniref:Uncharacterized protein n=1 Tax=Glonium stellatum TaxID=574774 RepID=A0A8E2EMF8_9PEZI|nr:hypothetical protein AOQ84DRAFT_329127 [Glonium stellatum]
MTQPSECVKMPPSSRPNVAFQVAPQAPSISNKKFNTSTDVLDFRANRRLPGGRGSGAASNGSGGPTDYQQLKRKADTAEAKARASISTKKTAAPKNRPHTAGPTKLRVGRPVKTVLCADLWPIIFQYSESSVLLHMKDVAPLFREILGKKSVWKESRVYNYGDQIPPPLHGLEEWQYADLRHGQGCMSCKKEKTRKTYWAFLRRWCKACLHSKIIGEMDAITMLQDSAGNDLSELLRCIPSATVDSWGNYVKAGEADLQFHRTVYLRSDVGAILAELHSVFGKNGEPWSKDQISEWFNEKENEGREHLKFSEQLENWEKGNRGAKQTSYRDKKDDREVFFTAQAATMTPPLLKPALELCKAYQRAIRIPKGPNMVAWGYLKPKLEQERAAAEEMVRKKTRQPLEEY